MSTFAPHRLMTAALVAVTLLVFAVMPARAETDEVVVGDQIILGLSMEDYVEAKQPLVRIDINASFKGSESGTARDSINKSLKALDSKADWKITNINRNQDKSGLERWYVNAEARVSEATLSGLDSKARGQSTPGFNVTIGAVQWHPTLAEREAAKRELRKKLYTEAKAELTAANEAFDGRGYRIAFIDFGEHAAVQPVMRAAPKAYAMSADMAESASYAPSAGGVAVTEHITMSATVVLEAIPPKAASGEKAE